MLIFELTTRECDEMLARLSFGRLGCSRDDQPYVVPFNFAYHERHLYSVTAPGQKIEWMRTNPRVCVEADDIVDHDHWTSVVVQGRYEELPDTSEGSADRQLAYALLQHRAMWWEPACVRVTHRIAVGQGMPIYYRVHIDRMTGRRATPDPVKGVALLEPAPTSRWGRLKNLVRVSRAGRLLTKAALLTVLLIVLTATPSLAVHWHGSVSIGVSPFWWGPPYPYWAYYPPLYYVYPPPPVIVQEPPVYIQQTPPAPALPPPPDGPYWYYCPSARAYYPTVPQCPEPWVKVPPRPE